MKFNALRLYREGETRVSRMVAQTLDDLDAGDVVIRAQYAAVNYKDARAVSGAGNVIKRFPCVPGIEVSGTVVSSTSPAWREGDAVTVQGGQEFGIRHDGAYAEFVRVPAAWVARIPDGFDAYDVVALGIGAYTSAVAVEELMRRGVTPDKGPIAVTGATGGCSSFAIDMLAALGYTVVASTGKTAEAAYLKSLAALLRTMKKGGVVCSFGNAAGETFTSSIYPFILRSVSLAGINANHPVATRGSAWTRMARGGDLRPRNLDKICFDIPFARLREHCDEVVAGTVRGRGVVRFGEPFRAS